MTFLALLLGGLTAALIPAGFYAASVALAGVPLAGIPDESRSRSPRPRSLRPRRTAHSAGSVSKPARTIRVPDRLRVRAHPAAAEVFDSPAS